MSLKQAQIHQSSPTCQFYGRIFRTVSISVLVVGTAQPHKTSCLRRRAACQAKNHADNAELPR